jgi:GGDEF domain-containing protein
VSEERNSEFIKREVSSNLDQRLERRQTSGRLAAEKRLIARLAFAKNKNISLHDETVNLRQHNQQKDEHINYLAITNAEKDARIDSMRQSIDRLAADELIEGLLSRQGFNEKLLHDKELQEKFRQGEFAVFGLDIRGLKAVNDASLNHGDELLILMAEKGLTRSLREGDLICRRGDDFTVFAMDVEAQNVDYIGNRIRNSLSVSTAWDDINRGSIPVMASVSSVHASEIPQPGNIGTYEGLNEWIKAIENDATIKNVPEKHKQYEEMKRYLPEDQQNTGDERRIADKFFALYCPHFVKQIEASMGNRKKRKLSK